MKTFYKALQKEDCDADCNSAFSAKAPNLALSVVAAVLAGAVSLAAF